MNSREGRSPDPHDPDRGQAPQKDHDDRHKESEVRNKPRRYSQKDVQDRPPPDPDPDDPVSP